MVQLELVSLFLFLNRKLFRFNSIMVQLEHAQSTSTSFSTPVSIPLWFNQNAFIRLLKKSFASFNSIMVQLEHQGSDRADTHYSEFQFHYGSIRTSYNGCIPITVYVSIPLWFNQNKHKVSNRLGYTCFNSIMVQLELLLRQVMLPLLLCFNSIMVQLELWFSLQGLFLTLFQFHYGSIRTAKRVHNKIKHMSFNSIMVQLEHKLQEYRERSLMFQFHYGSIRTTGKDAFTGPVCVSIPLWFNQNTLGKCFGSERYYRFNSIMVQLEL